MYKKAIQIIQKNIKNKIIQKKIKNKHSFKSYIKSPCLSYKHTTYFDSYDHFFCEYRNQTITFVEIGVLDGGSLFMWRDYFSPNSRIIGVDLNPEAKKMEKHGFEIFIGSQSDENFWKSFVKKVGGIDIVLDDGGHSYSQQIITTECLLENINDNGLILIEDTHTSYMSHFGDRQYSFIEYVKHIIDNINMRFGDLPKETAENRFWSVEIVESMVAFKIRREATKLKSVPIFNKGQSIDQIKSKDYRYEDNNVTLSTKKYFKKPQI